MIRADEGRRFYRIVKTNPPTINDFLSAATRGQIEPVGLPEDLRRLWSGVSVYATAAQARRKARQSPVLGSLIAEIRLRPGVDFRVERTTRGPGHHTIWASPGDLLACVISVALLEARSREK